MVLKRISSKKAVPVAFGLVVMLFTATGVGAMYRTKLIQSRISDIVGNALKSVELVSRIGLDVEKERLLVDTHIFESGLDEMKKLETEIRRVRDNFANAERAYDPLVTYPNEAASWDDLKRDIAAVQPALDRALEFSRANRDPEARSLVITLEAQFDDIDRDVARLVRINTTAADRAGEEVRVLLRSSSRLFRGLAALGVVLTLLIGAWATRLVGRREAEEREHAVALEARNRDLDAFAGRVAHDLRGPLHTLGLGVMNLPKETQEQGITRILRRSVDQMQQVIGDLLLLSTIDAEQRDAVCDPTRVATEVSAERAPAFDDLKGTLRVSVEPGLVRCGEGLLRQALANLVDNAMKYRRDDVSLHVELTGRCTGENYEIRVSDNGMGMSPGEAARACEPFYRAMRVHQAPGTGLGLSIVKRVIEANGGKVSIESQLGQGTTFLLILRRIEAQPTP